MVSWHVPSAASPLVTDPAGDANFMNNGKASRSYDAPFVGNFVTEPDLDDETDLLGFWFTHDRRNLYIYVQTEAPPNNEDDLQWFHVDAELEESPQALDAGGSGDCLQWWTVIGLSEQPRALFRPRCGDEAQNRGIEIAVEVDVAADGSGLITMITPRTHSARLADGQSVSKPSAYTTVALGGHAIDTTVTGASYRIDD